MSKMSRRTSRASVSKKDNTTTQELQICQETGHSYRPFTDPKRIEANDAKKVTKGDARALVKGVPSQFLSVMTTTDTFSASSQNTESSQSTPDSASLLQTDKTSTEFQRHEETLNPNSTSLQQAYPIDCNEHSYAPIQYEGTGVAVTIRELQLNIPSPVMCQTGDCQMHLLTSTSPDGSTSDSAYQGSFDHPQFLPFPCDAQTVYYDELVNGSAYPSNFDGGMLTDTYLSSGASSDSGVSDDSHEIDQMLDGIEHCMPMTTSVETIGKYHGSLQIVPSPTSQSPSSPYKSEQPYFGPQGPFLSGPDVISQRFNISPNHIGASCTSDQAYADALQNRQTIFFGPAGLDYLNIDDDGNSGDAQQGMHAYPHEAMDFNGHQSHCMEFITI